ncbi:MAG: TonB-dependent receptor, partial [Bacteroidota bacterium]
KNSKRSLPKIILLIGLTFSFLVGNAQNVISGKISDANDGSPLIGASVFVKELNTGTVADFNGNYSLNVKDGTYSIYVSFIGYDGQNIEITVTSGNSITQDFKLSAGIGMNEVVITASSTFRSQKEAPLSMSTLRMAEITRLNANSQADILRSIPGITAEGGGGETATNLFVRGLPSGGQYTFNPLQYDGAPLMTSFGLNSSAHDVYARPDIGFKGVEFVRGGAAVLYGAGSPAGIINYVSKTGDSNPGNVFNLETADQGRVRADFYSGGRLGSEDSKTFYAITGFMRYDNGPYETGVPTRGGQLRANLKKNFERGSFTVHTQFINDRAQFLMPLPLEGGSRERIDGNDGEPVSQLMSGELSNTSFLTAGGVYNSPYGDGVYTKGGYAMGDFEYDLASDLKFNAKAKLANYQHSFALHVGGNGANGGNPITMDRYMETVAPGHMSYSANYLGLDTQVSGSDLVVDNLHVDRIRPMSDFSGEASLTKNITTASGSHNITVGTFLGRSEAEDINFQYRAVSEWNNNPRLVNISYVDSLGQNVVYSQGGLSNRIGQTSNRFLSQNRTAFYLTDEIIADKWRLDVGVRYERTEGQFSNGNIVSSAVYTDPELTPELANVNFADGSFVRAGVEADGLAISIAGLYEMSKSTNLYANFSRGYFFPQLRGFAPIATGVTGTEYNPETIIQGEGGVKYGSKKLSGSAAIYYVALQDRISIQNSFVGGVLEQVNRNEQNTATIGLEAAWDYLFAEGFKLRGSLTFQSHEITKNIREDLINGTSETINEGNELARQPKLLGFLGLYYDKNNFDVFASLNHTGAKFTSDDNTIELDPINIIRLGAGYSFDLNDGSEVFRVGFSIFNLTDSQGITEGNPRAIVEGEGEFFFGRPILPRRTFVTATLNF